MADFAGAGGCRSAGWVASGRVSGKTWHVRHGSGRGGLFSKHAILLSFLVCSINKNVFVYFIFLPRRYLPAMCSVVSICSIAVAASVVTGIPAVVSFSGKK